MTLTPLQRLERRVTHLEALLAEHQIRPRTIEQCVLALLQVPTITEISPDDLTVYARYNFDLTFKLTSVSAVLCKMVRLGIITKASRPGRGFHSYKRKE